MKKQSWIPWVRTILRTGLAAALVYLAVVYFQRWTRPWNERPPAAQVKLIDDYYVAPPKSYISTFSTAHKLVGKPLWVREGYRWQYEPGEETFEPLEKIVPTGLRRRGEDVVLDFEKAGGTFSIAIAAGGRFYVDEMFFIKDPRELYGHWTDEMWRKVRDHQVEEGMSEFQIAFALGAGQVTRSSTAGETRIVEYRLCESAGIAPVRVTYRNNVAQQIEPL